MGGGFCAHTPPAVLGGGSRRTVFPESRIWHMLLGAGAVRRTVLTYFMSFLCFKHICESETCAGHSGSHLSSQQCGKLKLKDRKCKASLGNLAGPCLKLQSRNKNSEGRRGRALLGPISSCREKETQGSPTQLLRRPVGLVPQLTVTWWS